MRRRTGTALTPDVKSPASCWALFTSCVRSSAASSLHLLSCSVLFWTSFKSCNSALNLAFSPSKSKTTLVWLALYFFRGTIPTV
ncbi:hypothetical protein FKM82_014145 [Ascaphus truei]